MLNSDLLDHYSLVALLLVPGLIILFVRAQFVPKRTRPQFQPLLSYLAISLAYHAIALPFADLLLVSSRPSRTDALAWFAYLFAVPAMLGFLLALNFQEDLLRRLLRHSGLNNPIHASPTAWDWKFGFKAEPQWVLATLKDGTRFAGLCGSDSFISDDPAERDIYIERIYDIGNNGEWIDRGDNGLLIAAGEVRTIEFWPYLPQEQSNVSK